jgi:hypothetical protein
LQWTNYENQNYLWKKILKYQKIILILKATQKYKIYLQSFLMEIKCRKSNFFNPQRQLRALLIQIFRNKTKEKIILAHNNKKKQVKNYKKN